MIWLEPGEYSVNIDHVRWLDPGVTVDSWTTACACTTATGMMTATVARTNKELLGERPASIGNRRSVRRLGSQCSYTTPQPRRLNRERVYLFNPQPLPDPIYPRLRRPVHLDHGRPRPRES